MMKNNREQLHKACVAVDVVKRVQAKQPVFREGARQFFFQIVFKST